MVDTGATLVALGQSDAERMGLDCKNAQPGRSGNGKWRR